MRLTLAILGAALVAGCSDDPTEVIDPGPTGNPSIAFQDPPSGGAPTCVSIGEDANSRVPLLVKVSELLLRPPGGCGDIAQCGHLVLYANDVLNNETAARAVDLLVYKLGDPYHDGSVHAGSDAPDVLRVRVEAVDDAGEPLLDDEGVELVDSVELITVVDCAATDES